MRCEALAPTYGKVILKQLENDPVTVVTTFILKLKISSNLNGLHPPTPLPPKNLITSRKSWVSFKTSGFRLVRKRDLLKTQVEFVRLAKVSAIFFLLMITSK